MKRFFVLLILLSSLFALVSCGNSKPKAVMTVEDNAFSMTPQEYIDYINNFIEEQNDSRYFSIPDFVESENEIEIKNWYLRLKLTTNDDGKLTEIKWSWDSTRQGTNSNIGLYLSVSILMISADADRPDTVVGELDMLDSAPPMYDTSYTADGVLYSYSTYGHAQYNSVTITPAPAASED